LDFTVDENSNVDENEDRLSSSICSPSSVWLSSTDVTTILHRSTGEDKRRSYNEASPWPVYSGSGGEGGTPNDTLKYNFKQWLLETTEQTCQSSRCETQNLRRHWTERSTWPSNQQLWLHLTQPLWGQLRAQSLCSDIPKISTCEQRWQTFLSVDPCFMMTDITLQHLHPRLGDKCNKKLPPNEDAGKSKMGCRKE
jgi:hypothetical protein